MMRGNRSEAGQVIVVLAVVIVVLLGFTAVAIDGGMLYSDRRDAQNATDAAALAGALEKANNKSDYQVLTTVNVSLESNGYDSANSSSSVTGPHTDIYGHYYLVTVTLTDTTETYFAQMVFGGDLKNVVTAEARAQSSEPYMPGMAIIALGNCLSDGDHLLDGNGGGHSGGVRAFLGGIFLNTSENSSNHCALDAPENGYGIYTDSTVASIGSYAYPDGVNNIHHNGVQTNVNGGVPIDDPLWQLPEPQCTGAGLKKDDVWQPGTYSSVPDGDLAPGIYCITGDTKFSGHEVVRGSGVVLYLQDQMVFTGNGYLDLTAPDDSNCLGAPGLPTSSCTYKGIVIFAARNNTSTIQVRGNGCNAVEGMVYAINSTLEARGGGWDPMDAVIIGQAIVRRIDTDGGGDVQVTYNADSTYWQAPILSLMK